MPTTKERQQAVDLAMSQIERQFGKGAIMRLGSDATIIDIPVIPSGSLSLDIALGLGGVPLVVACVVLRLGLQAGATGLGLEAGAGHQPQGASEPKADGDGDHPGVEIVLPEGDQATTRCRGRVGSPSSSHGAIFALRCIEDNLREMLPRVVRKSSSRLVYSGKGCQSAVLVRIPETRGRARG